MSLSSTQITSRGAWLRLASQHVILSPMVVAFAKKAVSATWYSCFIISPLLLYIYFTRKIPSRLDEEQAPKSKFGVIPVIDDGKPVGDSGVE
jgi:hypothetical protein